MMTTRKSWESNVGYVTVRRLDHYGEPAIPTNNRREVDGDIEVEFILFMCKHGHRTGWFTRKDIS